MRSIDEGQACGRGADVGTFLGIRTHSFHLLLLNAECSQMSNAFRILCCLAASEHEHEYSLEREIAVIDAGRRERLLVGAS